MSQSGSPELKTLTIRCWPFHVLGKLASFILQLRLSLISLLLMLQRLSTSIQTLVLVLSNFNQVSLMKALSRYKEHIFTATRGEKTLDQFYPAGLSHGTEGIPGQLRSHLTPKYHRKLKVIKPSRRTVRQYSPPSDEYDVTVLLQLTGLFSGTLMRT